LAVGIEQRTKENEMVDIVRKFRLEYRLIRMKYQKRIGISAEISLLFRKM